MVLAYLLPVALALTAFMAFLTTLSAAALAHLSSLMGNLTLFALVVLFVALGAYKKVAVYDSFIEGAKEGFDVAKGLLPYLAMLCAVGVFRASGRWNMCSAIRWVVDTVGLDARFVDALPTALVKPFSGARAPC